MILKVFPVTLFKELVTAFRNPPVTVKPSPEPGCDSVNLAHLGKLQITKTTTIQTRMRARFSSPDRDLRQRACVNLREKET
jgi:hypothetical protein